MQSGTLLEFVWTSSCVTFDLDEFLDVQRTMCVDIPAGYERSGCVQNALRLAEPAAGSPAGLGVTVVSSTAWGLGQCSPSPPQAAKSRVHCTARRLFKEVGMRLYSMQSYRLHSDFRRIELGTTPTTNDGTRCVDRGHGDASTSTTPICREGRSTSNHHSAACVELPQWVHSPVRFWRQRLRSGKFEHEP